MILKYTGLILNRIKRRGRTALKWILSCILPVFISVSFAADNSTLPQKITGYYLAHENQIGGTAGRLDLEGPSKLDFVWPKPAKQKYKIALLVPQLADTWKTFSYAAREASKRLNLDLTIFSAESYINHGLQIRQLTRKAVSYDGILLSTIDSYKMADAINQVAQTTPIVGYANEVFASGVHAKAMVYYFDVSYRLGQWVKDHIRKNQPSGRVKIAFVMGPETASWSEDMLEGFVASLNNDPILRDRLEIIPVLHGHTKSIMQERLVRLVLDNNDNIDYLYGIAPAIERAASLKNEYKDKHPNLKLIAAYLNAELYPAVQRGDVLVSASDDMISIGNIAVSNLLRLIRGEEPNLSTGSFPYVSGPMAQLITFDNVHNFPFENLFGPKGYSPKILK
ncbi:substrate-binding domain-containing protein [Kiloniella sp.]|uniref:substrate-binding domain-containing protein n=1 Tax=Kiloniella sp. TaxID=1938587 RepID=UPI003B020043